MSENHYHYKLDFSLICIRFQGPTFMLFSLVAFLTALAGMGLLYFSNKNQRFASSQGGPAFRYAGYIFLGASLVIWLQIMTVAAAIFTWALLLAVLSVIVPVMTLFKAGKVT